MTRFLMTLCVCLFVFVPPVLAEEKLADSMQDVKEQHDQHLKGAGPTPSPAIVVDAVILEALEGLICSLYPDQREHLGAFLKRAKERLQKYPPPEPFMREPMDYIHDRLLMQIHKAQTTKKC